MPLVHHPRFAVGPDAASAAMPGTAHCPLMGGMADRGGRHAPSGDPSPLHHVPPCPICQALSQVGGVLPPLVSVIAPAALHALEHLVWPNAPAIRSQVRPAARPRAPPTAV